KQTPISIFISRKRQRLYIRQDFAPLFDSAITIAQPDALLGTHVFTALEFTGPEHTILRWNVVSFPGDPPSYVPYVEDPPARPARGGGGGGRSRGGGREIRHRRKVRRRCSPASRFRPR